MEEVQCYELVTQTGWAFQGIVPSQGHSIRLCSWRAEHLAVAEARLAFVSKSSCIAYTPATEMTALMHLWYRHWSDWQRRQVENQVAKSFFLIHWSVYSTVNKFWWPVACNMRVFPLCACLHRYIHMPLFRFLCYKLLIFLNLVKKLISQAIHHCQWFNIYYFIRPLFYLHIVDSQVHYCSLPIGRISSHYSLSATYHSGAIMQFVFGLYQTYTANLSMNKSYLDSLPHQPPPHKQVISAPMQL